MKLRDFNHEIFLLAELFNRKDRRELGEGRKDL